MLVFSAFKRKKEKAFSKKSKSSAPPRKLYKYFVMHFYPAINLKLEKQSTTVLTPTSPRDNLRLTNAIQTIRKRLTPGNECRSSEQARQSHERLGRVGEKLGIPPGQQFLQQLVAPVAGQTVLRHADHLVVGPADYQHPAVVPVQLGRDIEIEVVPDDTSDEGLDRAGHSGQRQRQYVVEGCV